MSERADEPGERRADGTATGTGAEAGAPWTPPATRGGLGPMERAMVLVVTVSVIVGGYVVMRKKAASRAAGTVDEPDVAIAGATLRTDELGPVAVAAFRLDEKEVTVQAYRACVDAGACAAAGADKGCNAATPMSDAHPINCVDHAQAEAFCRWRGRRLPTEDEWELSARGAEGRAFPWGAEEADGSRANLADQALADWRAEKKEPAPSALLPTLDGWPNTSNVGTFAAGSTKEGVADLAGNVREWTASAACAKRGEACASGAWIVRGSGYLTGKPEEARASFRQRAEGGARLEDLGFRCAR